MAEKRFFYAIMVFVFRCWIFHRRVPKYNVDVFINAVVTDGTDLSTGFSVFLFILRKFEEDFPFKSQQFEEKTAEYLKLTGKCATIS